MGKVYYGWVIVGVAFVSVLGAHGFGRFAYSLLLEDMRSSLGVDYTSMGLIEFGNFLGYMALATIGGFLASRYGSRIVMTVAALLMGASMIATSRVSDTLSTFITRLFTGLGNGGLYLPAVVLPSIWFPHHLRGRATGIVAAGIGSGFAAAGIAVPAIIQAYPPEGWRYAWIYMGAVLIAIALLVATLVRDRPDKPARGEQQTRTPAPAWGDVLLSPNLWIIGFTYLAYGLSYIIYITYLVAYMVSGIGIETGAAGRIFFMAGVLSISSGFIWGFASDKIGRRAAISLAYTTLAIAYLAITAGTPQFAAASAAIFGIAAWSVPTLAVVAAADTVGQHLRSAAGGFVTIFFSAGQAVGAPLGGYIIDALGFAAAFQAAAIISLAGAVLAQLIRRAR